MLKSVGYAARSATTPLASLAFERQEPGPREVQIDILYCGVCHSDLHQVRNEWHNTVYPCLPGHEIVGKIIEIGEAVTKFKVGDLAGVGCMINSCQQCSPCREGLEQYCEGSKGWTATYNGPQKPDGTNTFGGYSNNIVVPENFVLKVPNNLDLKAVAPLLCAGITTYSPMRHWNVSSGQRVGVVGLGGLGHMAIKLAKAMDAHVTVLTASPEKEADARRLGADAVVLSTDQEAMAKYELSFDYILNTIPTSHDINPYISLLKRDATLTLVGALEPLEPGINNGQVAFHRRNVSGSLIGGIAETQEVLDFCAEHNIVSDIELIPIQQINEAYDRLLKGDVKYRFVIDMASLQQEFDRAA
jgi:alcohol dehydrogenase (NADP+)